MTKPLLLALIGILAAASASAAGPSPAQKLAAAHAAGLTIKDGKAFDDCGQPVDDIQVEQVDLNSDKLPERIVTIGSPCYGNGGSMFAVLRKTPAGWVSVFSANGIASVLKTAHGGWKDIEVGGPGMGRMPVVKWSGTHYAG
jgi:hypothetical protein